MLLIHLAHKPLQQLALVAREKTPVLVKIAAVAVVLAVLAVAALAAEALVVAVLAAAVNPIVRIY